TYTLDMLGSYYEEVLTHRAEAPIPPAFKEPLRAAVEGELPPRAREWIGPYLEEARRLGQRTGELHVALASDPVTPELAPEPISGRSPTRARTSPSSTSRASRPGPSASGGSRAPPFGTSREC